ncbi:IPT/TIG domain-containing protein [Streptomyces sp. ME19-01-6]|uniref:IPT/TIG domain-containing protein n=1 Tax=Streptomyces sp. ME19-01-6 TaxID=3028686 RepID=UPI0029BE4982|nr:IPT/TIG domain-containing protein [Streptomyces sp. ME19-01-6]MDX3224702.1 IPT/TIG domain-containing protein [Streptomyces sp. ME19-01-6]
MATLNPTQGPSAGGNSVIITGTNFTGATSVKFGTKSATFTVNSATQITATAPSGNGVVGVTVTTPGGTTSPVNYFYVPQPIKTTLSNTSGPLTGATTTISGANLSTASSVTFGAVGSATPTVVNDSTLNVTAPTSATAQTVPITVTTGGGSTNGLFFTYVDAPTTTSITPGSGPEAGGTASTVIGTGLSNTTGVTYGATSAAFVVNSDTQLIAYAPPGTGTVTVNVTTPGGTDSTQTFTYAPPPG